jgi:hypothetical protein
MSKSPLSGAFADSSATTKKKSKKNGAILLISGIALATSIGGVFAANSITINSGAAIQFGQGVASTTSCDSALTTTLTQSFSEAANRFKAATVKVDGIDTAACSATTLRVGLYTSGNGTAIDTFTIVNPTTSSVTTDRSSANVWADEVDKITVTTE